MEWAGRCPSDWSKSSSSCSNGTLAEPALRLPLEAVAGQIGNALQDALWVGILAIACGAFGYLGEETDLYENTPVSTNGDQRGSELSGSKRIVRPAMGSG